MLFFMKEIIKIYDLAFKNKTSCFCNLIMAKTQLITTVLIVMSHKIIRSPI